MRGWSYRHHTKPMTPEDYPYHAWGIADSHPRMVVDRLHWSAYAYRTVYSNPSLNYTTQQWRMIELMLLSRNATILYLTDTAENILGRWGADEMYSSVGIVKLVEKYEQLYQSDTEPFNTHIRRVRATLPDLIDVSTGKPHNAFFQVAAELQARAARAQFALPPTLGHGALDAEFMVVGEQPGEPVKGSLNPPAVFDFGPVADYLWQAFDDIGLQWWRGYYTNASSFESPQEFSEYLDEVVTPKAILGLGGNAKNLMKSAAETHGHRIGFYTVEHPGYIRRFRTAEYTLWKTKLYAILNEWCTGDLGDVDSARISDRSGLDEPGSGSGGV